MFLRLLAVFFSWKMPYGWKRPNSARTHSLTHDDDDDDEVLCIKWKGICLSDIDFWLPSFPTRISNAFEWINTTQHDKYKYHLNYIRFIRSNETWKISTNVSNYSEIHNTKVEFVQASDGTLNISTMHIKSKKKLYIFNNTLMEWLVFPNAFSLLFFINLPSSRPFFVLVLILDFWSVLEHVVRVVKITPCLRCRNEEKTRLSNSRVQIYSSFLLIFFFAGNFSN